MIRVMVSLVVCVGIVGACGKEHPSTHPGDAAAPPEDAGVVDPEVDGGASTDAGAGVDASLPAPDGCSRENLAYSRTQSEVSEAIARFVDGLRTAGAERAYLRERARGTDGPLSIETIRHPLGVAASVDPRPAALAWLESVPDSPIRSGEHVTDPARRYDSSDPLETPIGGLHVAYMLRSEIDGVPFAASAIGRPALHMLLRRGEDGWVLDAISMPYPELAFATRSDAERMVACTPTTSPPEAPVRNEPITGLELEACAEVGSYSYMPTAVDRLEWDDVIDWQLGDASAETATWAPVQKGELVVDPSNYWPRVIYADCNCGVVGWTLWVNALTGERLRITPGINCVVC